MTRLLLAIAVVGLLAGAAFGTAIWAIQYSGLLFGMAVAFFVAFTALLTRIIHSGATIIQQSMGIHHVEDD